MHLFLNEPKPRRKSVGRVDVTPVQDNAIDDRVDKLGLGKLVDLITTKTVVRKSEADNVDLILDLEKAIDVEYIARKVHEEWMKTAPDSHPNKIPYDELTEKQKDKDRNTVNTVLRSADIIKADNSHLPNGTERNCYKPTTNYNVVYIPVNRLKQVYQTDEALNPKKVSENRKKMRDGIPLDPVEIGYNYDVHDGHHRWAAAREENHTHVPCEVVGTDPEKVKEAISRYKQVWKSVDFYVLDLSKAVLNTSKLVKKRVAVKGKMGKIFYRMQWVDPNDKNPAFEHTGKPDETTFHHHEEGIKDMEKRQSNKFPVVHHPTAGLKNTTHNYNTDRAKYDQAHQDYVRGKALPPVKINDKGEILEHHHLVDLAKKLGLTHIPSIVMGNTELKKKLEERLRERDQVAEVNEDGERVISPLGHAPAEGTTHSPNTDTFKNFTSKKYTKQHIMNEARKHGIEWKEDATSEHSAISWMRAYQAIVSYLNAGGILEIHHDEKEVDKRMKQDGWDSIHKHFLKLLEKHGSKQNLMEWSKDNGITWKYSDDPSINWMRASSEIKKELAKGKMIDGIRTRQKGAMDEANLVITDQIKEMVSGLGKKHGKDAVMERASLLGLNWSIEGKNGGILPVTSAIRWMRASQAISKYIAQGNTFTIGTDTPEDNKISAKVKDYGGVKLTNIQGVAVDLGKRNSQNFELKAKEWALKAFKADYNDAGNPEEMYQKFMENARGARLMLHFDPSEILPSGVSLLEQMSSDGVMKNRWEMGNVEDHEAQQLVEREIYGYDFDDAGHKERPLFGVVDLFNQGLKASPYGSVAFVLKDDAKKRTTGTHTDSANLDYETNGKLTRSLTDPHHLLVDRWTTKWKSPKNADAKRKRMMDSVMSGIRCRDDGDYFESQVMGGVNLRRDVDHILVPAHWQGDKTHQEKHDNIKALSKLMGFDIKYE